MVQFPVAKNPGKNIVIIATGYVTIMTFLFTLIYSGQPAVAIIVSGFVLIMIGYCYRYDLSNSPETTFLHKPLFLTSIYAITLALIASFFIFGLFILVRHEPGSPRDLLFFSFLTLPVFLFVVTWAINPPWTATDDEIKGSYQESFVLPLDYAKVFDLGMQSVQPPFRNYEIYSGDRISGIIRAGNFRKSLSGIMGQIVVTITVEKIAIGSTRITIHGINPEPYNVGWLDGPLCENCQPKIQPISDFIRLKAAEEKSP